MPTAAPPKLPIEMLNALTTNRSKVTVYSSQQTKYQSEPKPTGCIGAGTGQTLFSKPAAQKHQHAAAVAPTFPNLH